MCIPQEVKHQKLVAHKSERQHTIIARNQA